MKYSEFFKFLESKDRFIDSNPNLTSVQKQEVKAFFQKHPNYENKIDWNKGKSLTYDDFKPILDLEGKSASQAKKNGISGLIEGQDYILLGTGFFKSAEDSKSKIWNAYQPLTYYASRTIASNAVPPVHTDYGSTGAKWCTAWQKNRVYWDSHCISGLETLVYICGESIPTKKVAVSMSYGYRDANGVEYEFATSKDRIHYNLWDYFDDNDTVTPDDLPADLDDILIKAMANRDLIQKYHKADLERTQEIERQLKEEQRALFIKNALHFNEATKRYDCDQPIGTAELELLLNNQKDDFILPLGVIKGSLRLSGNRIKSLKNGPTEVERNFFVVLHNLTSLENGPKKVGGIYACIDCLSLTSLSGMPETVDDLIIQNCPNVKSLEHGPKQVMGNVTISNTGITSMEHSPETVNGSLYCYGNESLISLKGCAQSVSSFMCNDCSNLKSLEGGPTKVTGDYICQNCTDLIDLKGAPTKVDGTFDCSGCEGLTTFEGMPEHIGVSLNVDKCKNVKSPKGIAKTVGYNVYLGLGNNTKSAEFTDEALRQICDISGKISRALYLRS